jgi:hypothetical protein
MLRRDVRRPTEPSVLSKACTDMIGCSVLHSDSGGCFAAGAVFFAKRAKSVTFSLMECIRGVRFARVTRVRLWKNSVAHLADGVRVGGSSTDACEPGFAQSPPGDPS